MPFGDNDELPDGIGEHHPPHGESAGLKWNLVSRQESADGRSTLELELSTSVRPGSIRATWQLTGGDSCIYTRHRIAGNRGPVTLGHHATLTGQNGQLQIKSSPLLFGMTNAYQPPSVMIESIIPLLPVPSLTTCRMSRRSGKIQPLPIVLTFPPGKGLSTSCSSVSGRAKNPAG